MLAPVYFCSGRMLTGLDQLPPRAARKRAERLRQSCVRASADRLCGPVSAEGRETEEPGVSAVSAGGGVVVPLCRRGLAGVAWGALPFPLSQAREASSLCTCGRCRTGVSPWADLHLEPRRAPRGSGRGRCLCIQGARTGSGRGGRAVHSGPTDTGERVSPGHDRTSQ